MPDDVHGFEVPQQKLEQKPGYAEDVQYEKIVVPLRNKRRLRGFARFCKIGESAEINRCFGFDVFDGGKRYQRDNKTNRQRNRQVQPVKNKLFPVLKKHEECEVKRARRQRHFSDIKKIALHYSWFLIIFISSSNSSGDNPFSFTKNATALLYELSK